MMVLQGKIFPLYEDDDFIYPSSNELLDNPKFYNNIFSWNIKTVWSYIYKLLSKKLK